MTAISADLNSSEALFRAANNLQPLRAGLISTAAVLAAGAVVLETVGSRLAWREDDTEVLGEPSDYTMFGGLGIKNASQYAGLISSRANMSINPVVYSGRNFTSERIGDALSMHYTKTGQETQNIIGHSLGLRLAFEGIKSLVLRNRKLEQQKRSSEIVPIPPIKKVVGISSPWRIEDAHMEKSVKRIIKTRYAGGIISKMGVELGSAVRDENYDVRKLGKCIRWAASSPNRGDTGFLWLNKLDIFATEPPSADLFDGIITKDTEFFHIADPLPNGDKVVRIGQARENLYESLVRPRNCELRVVNTPGLGHANVEQSLDDIAGCM